MLIADNKSALFGLVKSLLFKSGKSVLRKSLKLKKLSLDLILF